MDKHRYSQDYLLKFTIIRTDKNRIALLKAIKYFMNLVIILFILDILLTILSVHNKKGLIISTAEYVNHFLSICFIAYCILAIIRNRIKHGGYLYMGKTKFKIKRDTNELDFMLDKVTNLKYKVNQDDYYRGWWKMIIWGAWYYILNPDINKENFFEFDYENKHHLFEIKLNSFSQQQLFERRLNEWIKNYTLI